MKKLTIQTNKEKEMLNITSKINQAILENAWQNGILIIFTPHTTAGLTINENADPDVCADILSYLQKKLVTKNYEFNHAEGNSDAHILSSLFGVSLQVIVEKGRMILGTWQGVFFCEFDGPRNREVFLKFLVS